MCIVRGRSRSAHTPAATEKLPFEMASKCTLVSCLRKICRRHCCHNISQATRCRRSGLENFHILFCHSAIFLFLRFSVAMALFRMALCFALTLRNECEQRPQQRRCTFPTFSLRRSVKGSNTKMHLSYRINGEDFCLAIFFLGRARLCAHRRTLHRNTRCTPYCGRGRWTHSPASRHHIQTERSFIFIVHANKINNRQYARVYRESSEERA